MVIFDENISFDHYFGTYPKAANTDGTTFKAAKGTPAVNGLSKQLLTRNPNTYHPARLGHEQAMTCDQDHGYGHEQQAYDDGKADQFVQKTGHDTCTGAPVIFGEPGLVMDYYDGNTVTGLWNYAQHYALSDNSFDTNYGPSTPGAINLISGQTHGVYAVDSKTGTKVADAYAVASPDANGVGTVVNDPDPAFDDCSDANHTSTNYDLTDFDATLKAGNLLAVSYLKAGEYQDGHAGYSDPLDEQAFIVKEINQLQKSTFWASTAVVVAYDDSDGWYDHVMPKVVNGSHDPAGDTAACMSKSAGGGYADRCGYGPRTPLLVISPWSKVNHVDHSLTDQTSILRFVEDNWGLGRIGDYSFDSRAGSLSGMLDFRGRPHTGRVLLDEATGAVQK